MSGPGNIQTSFWKSLSRLDWLALALCVIGMAAAANPVRNLPGAGFLRLIGVLAVFYVLYRFWSRWREELLWSLRNRLILAYLFLAVVPIVLLLILASMLGQILYSQLAAYLLYHDIEDRIAMMSDASAGLVAAEASLPSSMPASTREEILARQAQLSIGKQLPYVQVNFEVKPKFFQQVAGGPTARSFSGLIQTGNQLRLVGMKELESAGEKRIVEVSAPFTWEILENVAPDLGPIDITLAQTVEGNSAVKSVLIGKKHYMAVNHILTRKRELLPAESWLDPVVEGFSKLEAVYVSPEGPVERAHPIFAFYKARRSQLNHRIFASVGEFSGARVFQIQLLAVVFLVIELAALVIGIVLAKAITKTISELYRATQFVQEGNFSHRVAVERKDQLGVLGESFNSMTSSINRLIDEQKQLQRLENEISIAREVQDQLFPRGFPKVEGLEIEAICKAARSVSGDYYDFIQLDPTHVAIALGDISGKGISAALLMASLQAALRSQLLTPGSEQLSTAELVGRLNKHLVRNTGEDRFATFLVAVYDMETRKLRYTNAGHLPGFCLSDTKSMHLDVGGMVLGIVEDYPYLEGVLEVPRDAVFIAYSDGLVEPENAYGEEFGVSRLEAAAQRVRQADPKRIATALMTAAEEWSGTPEQADDMTVIVAKLK
ncbi:MAG TPA: SpoIIE family protein phosphatase [Candidatus Acidoferrales bacterium]|jgi:sigma-B regulation protein RsbU (phosphoserine phosphatase)|nr:SpoIIE family protein phosphatase [Candidatus Acidoferrales bacterium]